jgi:7,8-dihydropterin-6-yl-methyl-4-(beta-D-ribofuranosyl)aminobenzene 5'-phosphate synthase
MRLTVLLDNNTLIDRYFLGEPGVSYLIEEGDTKVLFDVGYSDAFITNAHKLAINLLDIDFIVLSHGHLDHTWGLLPLIRLHAEARIEGLPTRRPVVVSHPLTFAPRRHEDLGEIGSLLNEESLARCFELRLSSEPVNLTPRLVFLGEIERISEHEAMKPIGMALVNDTEREDFLFDDSALAYRSPNGLVIITGCSHAGICNIVEQARRICGESRVIDIVGGLHLLNPPQKQLQATTDYLGALNPMAVHACHCTDLRSKIALSRVVNLEEVGSGLRLEYE